MSEARPDAIKCEARGLEPAMAREAGIACQPGRHDCFLRELQGREWVTFDPALNDPEHILG